MNEKKERELINNFHEDFNFVHDQWNRGKIDNKTMLEKMTNLSFSLLRTLADDVLKG